MKATLTLRKNALLQMMYQFVQKHKDQDFDRPSVTVLTTYKRLQWRQSLTKGYILEKGRLVETGREREKGGGGGAQKERKRKQYEGETGK